MPLTLGQNISTLKAKSQLDRSSQELSKVFERLSSGLRVNSAADDPAGLAVATSLNSDARIFTQALRNANDGISLLNVADSALEALTTVVTQISELASQAANGSFSAAQRRAIDAEAQALSSEYQRIARSTSFNGMNLFDGSFGRLTLQVGADASGTISSGLGGAIGTGSFGSANLLTTDTGTAHAYGVTLADLNADGAMDIITTGDTDATTGFFTIRLGTGTGSFGTSVSYSDGVITWRAVVDDINNDGIVDLVTAGNDGTNGIATVRLGRGDGTFGTSTSYATETASSYGLALGDLNGDGNIDLVTTGQSAGADGYTTIRLGLGNGTFGAAISYAAETGVSREVQLGDLNGDGRLDIVTIGRTDAAIGYFTARLGQADGSFATSATYVVAAAGGSFTWGMALADFNGDGSLDVIGGSANSAVYLGVGDGTFSAAGTITSGGGTVFGMSAGDINGDGKLDLVSANSTSTTVYIGNGDGTFVGPNSNTDGFTQTRNAALADLNTDGVLDLVSVGSSATPDGLINVRLASTTEGVAPLLAFSLKTATGARTALEQMAQKLTQLSAQRAQIGSFESRLDYTTRFLNTLTINYREAASRILDADVATDVARMVALQIRQQATVAVLAQSRESSTLVLDLLRV